MSLKEQLQADLATAMREGDPEKRDTLRMVLAAIKQEEVDGQFEMADEGVQKVLTKQAKQRREAIVDAEKAGRQDLADQEKVELEIIDNYLPQMMSAEEIQEAAAEVIAETGATNMQDMGRVMGQLMPKLQGKADGRMVSDAVRQLLQS